MARATTEVIARHHNLAGIACWYRTGASHARSRGETTSWLRFDSAARRRSRSLPARKAHTRPVRVSANSLYIALPFEVDGLF